MTSPLLRIFVYGSLKRGCENFPHYCARPLEVVKAAIWGRLYLQTSGYPMLQVPDAHVLALGTRDYLADARLPSELPRAEQASVSKPPGDWQRIEGELFTFDDPERRLAQLDELEDFRPGEPCLYHRAVVPVLTETVELTWTYIAPDGLLPPGCTRIAHWPL